jgi:hypothetical protein
LSQAYAIKYYTPCGEFVDCRIKLKFFAFLFVALIFLFLFCIKKKKKIETYTLVGAGLPHQREKDNKSFTMPAATMPLVRRPHGGAIKRRSSMPLVRNHTAAFTNHALSVACCGLE